MDEVDLVYTPLGKMLACFWLHEEWLHYVNWKDDFGTEFFWMLNKVKRSMYKCQGIRDGFVWNAIYNSQNPLANMVWERGLVQELEGRSEAGVTTLRSSSQSDSEGQEQRWPACKSLSSAPHSACLPNHWPCWPNSPRTNTRILAVHPQRQLFPTDLSTICYFEAPLLELDWLGLSEVSVHCDSSTHSRASEGRSVTCSVVL